MKKFDEAKFQEYLDTREVPKTILKSVFFDNVKINNVPVIMQEKDSDEFTMPVGTASKIYKLLAINKITENVKEIDYA